MEAALAGALEQSDDVVGVLAVLEGGGEREDENKNDEEEIAALAGGKRQWRLLSKLSGEEDDFWMWRLRIACMSRAGRTISRHISMANSQDMSKDLMTTTQAHAALAAAMLWTAHCQIETF